MLLQAGSAAFYDLLFRLVIKEPPDDRTAGNQAGHFRNDIPIPLLLQDLFPESGTVVGINIDDAVLVFTEGRRVDREVPAF